MRIASLVPSATEMLYALGLGEHVVGVTHECDYPPEAAGLPQLTRSVIAPGLSSLEIDQAVKEVSGRGDPLYELDAARLAELEPDLIVTQALCEVCAVAVEDVRAVAEELSSRPRVLSLDPTTLGEVLGDASRLAEAAGAADAGAELARTCADRIDRVRESLEGVERPRVAALEWLAPPFVGGHWVPQLIELAGGEDPLGLPGERSRESSWEEIAASEPQVLVAMPCGYGTERAAQEARDHLTALAALGARRLVAVDASAYFSRPGPRLVDGLELLAHVLHPGRIAPPPPGRMIVLDEEPAPAPG